MMSPEQILDAANRAYHDNRIEDWRAWFSLLRVMGYQPNGYGGIVLVTEIEQQARERLALRGRGEFDDLQFDYEREAEAQGVSITELMR